MGSSVKDGAGIPQLNGTNYENWRFRVKLYLEAAEVSEALTEEVPEAQGEPRNKFLKTDRKAKSLLVGFVGDECLEIVRDKETARTMWKALEDTFAKKSVASQTLLRKQLARLRMKEGTPMRSHFTAFDELVRQLKSAGAKLEENDLVSQLFLTLPDSYDHLVTALENIDEKDLTLDTVKQRLLGEESKRADRADNSIEEKSAAFVGGRSKKQKKFNGKCHRCGKTGHMQKDCRVKKSEGDANAVMGGKAVTFMVNKTAPSVDHECAVFVVDSGCSDHLVNNRSYLHEVRKLKEPFVVDVAKNGVCLVGEYEGIVKGITKQGVRFEMKNVVYLPDLRGNLLSVKKLSKAGIDVLFTRHGGMEKAVMKHDGVVIAVAQLRRNLYELRLELETDGGSANLCTSEVSTKWHRRLGHASQQALDALVRHDMVTGLEPKPKRIGFCDTCVLGKQCREPFDGTRERATRPLERVHSDVCGPIDPPSWDGSRYFVSFIDDFTHFAVIQPIRKKTEVFARFKEYEAMATTHWEKKISKLTVDQGREYCSDEQRKYYTQKGIQLQPTVSYSPQQNGVAERFNRTLVEKVRTMLIDSNMPKSFWSEAALMGTYLLNRSPTSALNEHVTPAECWLKAKPDFGKLRIFGCKAFAWLPKQKRKKLDSKSREAVMIGFAPNGYRLWDRTTKKVFIARDVKFNEECYPFREKVDTEVNVPLIIPVRYQQEEEIKDDDVVNVLESDSGDEDFNDTNEGSADEGAVGGSPFGETNPGALPSQHSSDDCQESTTRRSERERKLPGKFLDFFTGFRATSAGNISPSTDPPCTYDDITSRDDRESWLDAIENELTSLKTNNVWKLVKRPLSSKPLKSKWVFRVKEDEHGNTAKCKARLVVKGFLQKPGMDYQETYAPVAKLTTIRTVLAVGVQRRCLFHQMDVKTAFLHGDLREEIYIEVPDGVEAPSGMVCRLQKSLYGLKQSPRCWNDKFNDVLLKLGFERSKHDYCLYIWCSKDGIDTIYLVLYVDDLLIVGTKLEAIQALKRKLSQAFEMTDCGVMKHFLGINITYDWNTGTMQLSQAASINKLLTKFGLADCNSTRTPMEKGLQMESKDDDHVDEPYRELLGSLMYIMMSTRPDICYPVGYLGRFQQQPGQQHWLALKRVVRYLKGTKNLVLELKKKDETKPLVGYADADWATDTTDRKSVSGFLFKVYGNTVSWSSKKQTTVATSSSEAEYVALSSAATEAIWLTGILRDLGVQDVEPVPLFEDNRGCIGMAKNVECKRAKHIDIKHHFVRDHVAAGRLTVESISTLEQLADIFTKALDAGHFEGLRRKLGVYDREEVKTK